MNLLIYIILFIIIFIINIFGTRKVGKIDIVFFLILAIVSGFRYDVGTDFFSYVNYFNLIDSGNPIDVEPGFLILSKFISFLNLNSQALFILLSSLTMIFFYKGLVFYTKGEYTFKPVLYIIFLLFTFIPSLNVVRQLLATAIIFYASRHIIDRNFIKYFIWVIIASLFHTSSIALIVLYFIVSKSYKISILLSILLVSIVMTYFNVFTVVLEFILIHFPFLDIGDYISYYLISDYNSRHIDIGIVNYVNIFVVILFVLLKNKLFNDQKSILSFNLFYLFNLFSIIQLDASVISRLTYFFSIYMAIAVPRFGILFDKKSRHIVEYLLLILYSILYLYNIIFAGGSHDIIPYEYNLNLKD